jgi:hypothetical protein
MRAELRDSVWITDDRSAGTYARRRGITTKETYDLVNEAVVGGLIAPGDGHGVLGAMAAVGRHLHRVSRRRSDLQQ